jgi:hypothetical protein
MLSEDHRLVAPTARSPQRTQDNHALRIIAHVGVAGRQPNPGAARGRDHRRRLPFASAFSSAKIVDASTDPDIRIRPPKATSISLFVVIGVREGGQDVLLTVKSIGGETTEAWRAVLDESPGIGRASP